MYVSGDTLVQPKLSPDGGVGGSAGIPAVPAEGLRLDALTEEQRYVANEVFGLALNPYAKWTSQITWLESHYASSDHVLMVANLVRSINAVGPEEAFKQVGGSDDAVCVEMYRSAQRDTLDVALRDLRAAASFLGTSSYEIPRRRGEALLHLAQQTAELGPHAAFDEMGIQFPARFTEGSKEGAGIVFVTSYISSMLCDNPPRAFEDIIRAQGFERIEQALHLQRTLEEYLRTRGDFAHIGALDQYLKESVSSK